MAKQQRSFLAIGLVLGQDALTLLGFVPYEAYRLKRIFRKKDEEVMPDLYRIHREDEAQYISMYQKNNTELEEIMSLDQEAFTEELDKAWTAKNPED